jgi:hypothetical protein
VAVLACVGAIGGVELGCTGVLGAAGALKELFDGDGTVDVEALGAEGGCSTGWS